jgi:4-carboxymuconolactone decarboxylase
MWQRSPDRSENGLENMDEFEQLQAARAMRRAILGDDYVDAMSDDPDPVADEFQDYLTTMAWGAWARGGPLSPRDRSLLGMAMTVALARMTEFRSWLHAERGEGGRDLRWTCTYQWEGV